MTPDPADVEAGSVRATLAEIKQNLRAAGDRLEKLPTKDDLWSLGIHRLVKTIAALIERGWTKQKEKVNED